MKYKIPTKAILIFLLITAAVLRIASAGKYVFLDETPILSNVFNFFKNHSLLPTHFNYPTLFSYIATIPVVIGAIALYMLRIIPSLTDIGVLYRLDSIIPILPARFTSAVFGLATIFILFKIGEKYYDRKTGLIAAALLCFSKLHIHFSGYALPDVTMTFFATCSLFFSLSALKTKSMRDFILAGAFAGFTASTKYNGALIILPIVSVHLLHLYDEKSFQSPQDWFHKRIIFSGLAFICAFFIGSPGWLFIPGHFWEAFAFERMHMATGHLGTFGIPYVSHLIGFWNWEKTIAVFFLLGLIYAIFRHTRQDIVLLILILLSFFYIGSWQKKSLHYLLFIYPALSLLSARLLSEIVVKFDKKVVTIGTILVIISVFTWPICSSTMDAHQQILKDSRKIAQEWIQNNIPGGSTVVVDWAYIPKLFTEKQKMEERDKHKEFFDNHLKDIPAYEVISLAYSPAWLEEVQADYLITSSACFNRFFTSPLPPPDNPFFAEHNMRKDTYMALFNREDEVRWKLLREFYTKKGPRILIYERIKEEKSE